MSYGSEHSDEGYAGPGKLTLILFGLFCAACLVFICGGIGVGFYNKFTSDELAADPAASKPSLSALASKQKKAGTFTVLDWKTEFETPAPPGDSADLAGIERLFDALLAASEAGSKPGIRSCFDDTRRFEEVTASRLWPTLTRERLAEYKTSMPAESVMPTLLRRHKLVSIRPTERPDEVVVTGYFWHDENDCTALQFRLVRRGRWKVFDVTECGFSLSFTERDALYMLVHMEQGYVAQEFTRNVSELYEACELLSQAERAEASQKLRNVRFSSPRKDLTDNLRLVLASAWASADDPQQVIAAVQTIEDKEASFEAHRLLAWAHARLGQHVQVIEASNAFTRAGGQAVRVAPLLAAANESLDRPADAVRAWQTALRGDPENPTALYGLARLLDESEHALLTNHLRSLAAPVKTCQSLLDQIHRLGDRGAPGVVVKLIGELAPDSAAAERAKGRLAQYEGEPGEAAPCFARAAKLETDPDAKRQNVAEYVDAMVGAEQVLQAYTDGPDPDLVFEHLSDLMGDDETEIDHEVWKALLAARREKHPDDPRARLMAGRLLVDEQKDAEAEQEFAAGLAKTQDEDLRDELKYARDMALARLGRATEVYSAAKDPNQTFRSLANVLNSLQKDQELSSLVALHRAKSPEDPWLDLFTGRLRARAKDWKGALQSFNQGERIASEPWLQASYRRERMAALIELYGIMETYRRLGSNSETFVELANHVRYRTDVAPLAQLVAAHRQAMPTDPQLLYWEAELMRRSHDDQGFLRIVRRFHPATRMYLTEQQMSEIGTHWVRVLLRQNRQAEAANLAGSGQFGSDPFPALLAAAGGGNVPETARLMREVRQRSHAILDPYRDADLAGILRRPEFLPVRQEFPPTLTTHATESASVVLFLERAPAELNEATLRTWLPDNVRGGAQIRALPKLATVPDSLVAQFGSVVVCVSRGTGLYSATAEKEAPRQIDARLRQVVLSHGGWLHVAVDPLPGAEASAAQAFAGQIGAAIAQTEGPNCQGYFTSPGFQVQLADAAGLARLRSGIFAPPEAGLGPSPSTWYLSGGAAHDAAHSRQLQRVAREFRAAWAKRPAGRQFSVQAEVQLGSGVERLWLTVDRRQADSTGNAQLHARLAADSLLRPELKTNEPVLVNDDQLIDWRQQ